ncbi:MAG TPA: NAD(P)/FAD-dependent oxidoreductase [Clostridiaceae bacterium]|nr:NAD(P)/FAD-dependent oxidoreductase [Clostridiaceae bacterium]
MEKKKIVIIGSGAAGVAAAEEARKNDSEADIVIYSADPDLPFYRLRVAEVLRDPEAAEKLYLHPAKWYEERSIRLVPDTHVDKIDYDAKNIKLENNETVAWDRLIVTTGSRSFVLPLKGFDRDNCFTLWSLQDAKKLSRAIREKGLKTCAIIGGGLLGLEAAWQIHQAGVQVKILEFAPILLQRQLDPRGSDLVQKHIESLGIEVITGADSAEVIGEGETGPVQGIILKDGRRIDCDCVLMSVGVMANTDLAVDAGLEIGRRIKVDEGMNTSLKDVYAAGDVCEVDDGFWFGLWSISMAQGKVAGANAAGANKSFVKETPPYIVNTMNTRIVSQGILPQEEGEGYSFEITEDPERYSYKKLVYKDGKLTGFILLGDYAKEMVALQQQLKD